MVFRLKTASRFGITSTKNQPPRSKPCLCSSGIKGLQISAYALVHLLGPLKNRLWGKMSLLPKLGIMGIAYWSPPCLLSDPKTSLNLFTRNWFWPMTWSTLLGIVSSLSCLAESPVHMTKSMSSLMFFSIHLKVALIRLIGESQSLVSAPQYPAGPACRWQAISSSVEEYNL